MPKSPKAQKYLITEHLNKREFLTKKTRKVLFLGYNIAMIVSRQVD
jgi:hypothetical protein